MYQCKSQPITARKNKRVIEEARRFIAEWRAESRASRPCVRVRLFGRKERVFIDDFHYHIEKKSPADMIGRYRLVPCVKELLKHSEEKPVINEKGNWELEGVTPDGKVFRVIIRPEKRGGCLQSFYPVRK
ncbi:hypothetical protein Desti_0997 [Desulfomonile tiedjei DSM 6799]|uniref:Bacterial EndoU nuclease domain-containing protein n=1 Tax=Desulfomonile tiedjei (strain ATCC 49306 / DSM 6799 / DCB-1) TaxID=706587 RepID=I4C2C4_DESTA|nr:hypothetical protein Desti_0997 [Desulfomonile tiedjei DSM 6799]